MDKNKIYLSLAVVILILIAGMYLQKNVISLFSVVSGDLTCSQLEAMKTNGAGPGECFVFYDANQPRLGYVNSAIEKFRSVPVTYANPDGKVTSCTMDTCDSCISNILSCKTAKTASGDITVCKYDSDCGAGGQCVMGMCRQSSVCSSGEKKCLSDTTYSNCLSSGHFSGILYCSTGKSCYMGDCLTQSEIDNINAPYKCGTGTTYNPTTKLCDVTPVNTNPIDNQTLLIGGGIGAAILIAIALKK